MREVTIYYADDGTRFDNEDECYDYEEECCWKNLIDDYNIELYDEHGNVPRNFDEAVFVEFKDEQAVDGFNEYAREHEIYYHLSQTIQPADYSFYVGRWVYDSTNDEWASLEGLEAYIKRMKEKVGW